MSDSHKVTAAEIEVERRRAALLDTANALLERFQPQNLMSDFWEQTKIKGADLAEDAVDAVKKRPVAVGGALAALTMFLAREPLKDVTVKFYDAMTSLLEPRATAKAAQKSKAKAKTTRTTTPKAPAKPARPAAKRPARARPRAATTRTESV